MMKSTGGPITTNGIHPISKRRVVEHGHKGGAKESPPKTAQVAAAGAGTQHGGHQKLGKPSAPLAPKQGAETKTTGSTAEEQKKTKGNLLYPKMLGLRGAMTNT